MTTETPTLPAVRLTPARAHELALELRDHDRRLASDLLMVLSANNPTFTTVLWASTESLDVLTVIHLVAATDVYGHLTDLSGGYYDFDLTNPRSLTVFVDPRDNQPQRLDLELVRAWVQTHVIDAEKAARS